MAKKNKKKRKIKKGFLISAIIAAVVIILTVTLWAVIKFVPNINILTVDEISVSGDEVYPIDTIISSSGVNKGISILKLNFDKIEKKLENELPYIKSAEISYSLDGILNIEITATKVAYSVKTGDSYCHFDSEFKLLEKLSFVKKGMVLCGIEIDDEKQVGEYAVDEKSNAVVMLKKIENLLAENSLSVDAIDLENSRNFLLVYKGRYIVELGEDINLTEKITLLSTMAKDLPENETGKILLKFWSEEDRRGSVLQQNIEEYLNKY